MATTTVATTVGTLKLAGAVNKPSKQQPDFDRLSHACIAADELVTQLNLLNENLLKALERLRRENSQLQDREKCLGAEAQIATRKMRRWRMLSLAVVLIILFAAMTSVAMTPYAVAVALANDAAEFAVRGLERINQLRLA